VKSNDANILIVDDENNVLDALRRNLNKGYNVVPVSSGQEAIEKLLSHEVTCDNYSVIISDYRMPGMSGVELLNRVKAICPELVRIMLTGVNDLKAFKDSVNQSEVFRLLLKPCPSGELIRAVNDAVLEHDRLKQANVPNHSADYSIEALTAALETRDYITGGHAERMSEMCYIIGFRLGLSTEQLQNLDRLALLHDIGKIGIPDNILFKPGPLTDEERDTMKTHPEKGFKIAQTSPELSGIANLILTHHERWDGRGYPLGLKGDEIPLESRILAVVDTYDVFTHERPYKLAKTREEALQEIEANAGSRFDPQVVHEFLKVEQDFYLNI